MTSTVIQVEGLSKRYRLGSRRRRNTTFASALGDLFVQPARNLRHLRSLSSFSEHGDASSVIWALNDVSFEVEQGEALGIIGRNGSGKSTLLKILSQIAEPTSGRVSMRGRVGSLLEVGTGFHPELTGRENVYLNGAILGMTRGEIDRKFDEIVDFSGVEQFIDTPVKHYSSGMKVRLAFAVAAHLEPEVLLIDEVLAVGDAEFQQKCQGIMGRLASSGRTVLFVSHNMEAVIGLCKHAFILNEGHNSERLPTEEAVRRYLRMFGAVNESDDIDLTDVPRTRSMGGTPLVRRIRMQSDSSVGNIIKTGDPLSVVVDLASEVPLPNIVVSLVIVNELRQRIFMLHTKYHSGLAIDGVSQTQLRCDIPSVPLVPGDYWVEIAVASMDRVVERIENAARLRVGFADIFGTGVLPNSNQGAVAVPCQWSICAP